MHPALCATTAWRHVLALGCGLAAAGAAWAVPANPVEFDIPAGPLAATLLEIARRADTIVSFQPTMVDQRMAPVIRGRLTIEQALTQATQASGLAVQVTPGGSFTVVVPAPAPPAAGDPALALPAAPPDASLVKLPAVVITGTRSALDDQHASDSVVNVLRRDNIRQLPDQNAAEALQRVPGLGLERDMGEGRYVTVRGLNADLNAVTINGTLVPSPERNTRGVMLDVLPSTVIQSMEVTKTLSAENDANSLGGTVNVRTSSAFDLAPRTLLLEGGGSHDGNTRRTSPRLGLLGATRLLEGKLGIAAGLYLDKRRFGADTVETDGAWQGALLQEFERRDYQLTRSHQALSLNLDYRPRPGAWYRLRGFTTRLSDTELRETQVLKFAPGVAEGGLADAEVKRKLKQRLETDRVSSLVLSSEHRFGAWTLGLAGAASRSTEDTPAHLSSAVFDAGSIAGVGFSDSRRPTPQGPGSLYDVGLYRLQRIDVKSTFARDDERNLRLDLGRSFSVGPAEASVKLGAKASRRRKTADQESWSYSADDLGGAQPMSAFLGGAVDYPFGPYTPALNAAALQALLPPLSRTEFRDAVESAVGDYTLTEDIDAAYLQAGAEVKAWRLLAGLRYEGTRFSAAGSGFDNSQFVPVAVKRRSADWLPSLQVRRDLDARSSLRAAWTTAVVRPSFGQASPGFLIESDEGNFEASFGNPNLRPLRASNLDLGVERRLGAAGLVSAYVFGKRIRNFIYRTDFAGTPGFVGFDHALTFVNGDEARIAGVELAYVPDLAALPEPFNGLLFSANASLARSRARIAGFDAAAGVQRSRVVALPGQSNSVVNLNLGYSRGPLTVRAAAHYRAAYLQEPREVLNPAGDLVVGAQTQWDLSLSYQVSKSFSLVAEGTNLTNAPYYVYKGVEPLGSAFEQYGRTLRLGLRASLLPAQAW